jgi:valyl-tRNA synthetase
MTELEKAYDHTKVEDKIYKMWEESGFFNPDNLTGEPYTIIMPPPNANAPMHLGHALFVTIEDILIRYQRMQGKKVLWQPGTDHAGFETQVVYEKKLEKEGRSRFGMQRDEFYKEVWDFVQGNKHITENSLKRLGASCDWSRNIFTLDPEIVKVVYSTFSQMHKDGLIYRDGRICNWCSKHQTGLADLETKYEERVEPFYYFKYGPFTIGTSRPETKFGDKYVVMHPEDKRYAQYKHGDTFEAEWINGPVKATVIKDSSVDMEFGSGVMTITPWHDAVDFEIAKRHNLEKEQIIDLRGKLLPIAGEFSGMRTEEARPKIVEKLKAKGLLEKQEDTYKHNVQTCYKCNRIIEPQIVQQWYIAMTKQLPDGRPSLRDMAVNAIKEKKVEILTEKFEKTFMHWMDNIRDWPISRQIWWGIPIPVKYCENSYKLQVTSDKCKEPIVDTENKINKCPGCNGNMVSDPDTFDTWFSSGQWPFATLMANDAKKKSKNQEIKKSDIDLFFPTQVMETGWDILFFWVARMVMLSYYKMNKPPFEKIYLHGLVRDKDKQKMSKSKGNVIDPLGVIDTYGTDALRFALIFSTSAGNDIPLAEDKIKGMKHFANKLWNIARYILANVEKSDYKWEAKTDADKEIIAKLEATIKTSTEALESFRLHEAAQEIYQFTWKELADVYIEASKPQITDEATKENTQKLLLHNLIMVLKLLHPFMPFVTEEIWSKLKQQNLVTDPLLMVTKWPK